MNETPSPLEAAQSQCRRGTVSVLTGLKLITAGIFLTVRRRYRIEMGLGGVSLVVVGALAWMTGHQTQKDLKGTHPSREIKPTPGRPLPPTPPQDWPHD